MEGYVAEQESRLLGQEFLTWLWYKSDEQGGRFQTADGEWFAAHVEQRITVQGGEGDSKETATVTGQHSELREAKLGVRNGKKVNRGLIRFESDGMEWSVQLKSEDFSYGSLRTPKVETKRQEGEDPDAIFLEKIYLIEKCLEYLDSLYRQFLELRLSRDKWEEELGRFRNWLRMD
jgi:hypothetical protein